MGRRENDWQPEPPAFAYNIGVRICAHVPGKVILKPRRAASTRLSKARIILKEIEACRALIGT
jgi:hypothetical protein